MNFCFFLPDPQTRIRAAEAIQANHKMVQNVTLVSSNGSELARLPGGAELNILPANGVFRSVKTPLTVQGGKFDHHIYFQEINITKM